MRLEQQLVLNRYFHFLFGADELNQLKEPLNVREGPSSTGQSYFYGALHGRVEVEAFSTKLAEYDTRVMAYEKKLAQARGRFAFKYFQYLALLYTEIFLDRLTSDPQTFVAKLNKFLESHKKKEPVLSEFPPFELDDLRRMAFFMATGSGGEAMSRRD